MQRVFAQVWTEVINKISLDLRNFSSLIKVSNLPTLFFTLLNSRDCKNSYHKKLKFYVNVLFYIDLVLFVLL